MAIASFFNLEFRTFWSQTHQHSNLACFLMWSHNPGTIQILKLKLFRAARNIVRVFVVHFKMRAFCKVPRVDQSQTLFSFLRTQQLRNLRKRTGTSISDPRYDVFRRNVGNHVIIRIFGSLKLLLDFFFKPESDTFKIVLSFCLGQRHLGNLSQRSGLHPDWYVLYCAPTFQTFSIRHRCTTSNYWSKTTELA